MNQIAKSGLKIDLHIHSFYSAYKDGSKVSGNTIEKINCLINKLNDNEVNICSITDHDKFSYELYKKLKMAEQESCSIQKILPGVEFSVLFTNGQDSKVIHIVTIFNDKDESKIKNIELILNSMDNKYDYGDSAYTEEKYLSILRAVDLDTIMIAHQKSSLESSKPRKNDANCLGVDKLNEFLFTDYFEAFEFKNKKNEIFNKIYIEKHELKDELRFVTGTDCHDWDLYPFQDKSDTSVFQYTYIKCLPTFKGVVMAMTDYRRIKHVNSFFGPDSNSIESIELRVSNQDISIPLSKGINVIIGDNSVGKSLLLHALTNYSKNGLKRAVTSGYKKYLKHNKIEVKTLFDENEIFCFDMQGEVREKFEENTINRSAFLKDYFPIDIDTKPYILRIDDELNRFYVMSPLVKTRFRKT